MKPPRPDYGIDAPGVIRNLLLVAAAGLIISAGVALGWWSGVIRFAPTASTRIVVPIARMTLWPAVTCLLMAAWMVWDSRIGKVRDRERLLDFLPWTGAEQVLDLGCGRGLMLIGAAKRLTTGTATGVDIWQAEDLSGNKPEATARNAELEGVTDRVRIETADMRKLPFPDGTFDAVVSCAAVHNLYAASDREQAISEVVRVLKRGGRALIDDIRHGAEYTRAFESRGCSVRNASSAVASLFLTIVTFGSLRPVTIVATKGDSRTTSTTSR